MTAPRHHHHQWVSSLLLLLLLLLWCGEGECGGCTRVLPDGEVELRLHRGRVRAVQTEAGNALTLLQATDGRRFAQLIYDGEGRLSDCELLPSPPPPDFDASCDADAAAVVNGSLPGATDFGGLRRACRALHRRVRRREGGRQRRDLFLYPGTNWCGFGSNARKFNELGYNAAADRCCRDHDHCPYTIEGFTRSYNFFNFRLHTISHCDCDERFRACLKLSGTAAGNMVGKLFFNVVQTKCFLFKHVKKCSERSWWGKCLKYEKEKTAFLRDALHY